MSPRRLSLFAILLFAIVVATFWRAPVQPDTQLMARGDSVAAGIALSALPPEARKTWRLIEQGGPFPYTKDGTTFFNREGHLPHRQRGYYSEYTVPTPGARDRGARRIIVGGAAGKTLEYWYTDDHYRSFRRIRE